MPQVRRREPWPTWYRRWPDKLNSTKNLFVVASLFAVLAVGLIACGSLRNDETVPTPQRDTYAVVTEYVAVTPTAAELPDGWWNPIDDKKLELLEYSLVGIEMWGNCVWYIDDPSPRTEEAVRSSLAQVIDSPVAEQIGIIQGADLDAVCEESAAVADFSVEVTDGRRAAMASELMIDLIDSCVSFYAVPEQPLAYRIAITFIDMLWMLELDTPRWPRRDYWGVREWCDNVVDGAVAS